MPSRLVPDIIPIKILEFIILRNFIYNSVNKITLIVSKYLNCYRISCIKKWDENSESRRIIKNNSQRS